LPAEGNPELADMTRRFWIAVIGNALRLRKLVL
jgi:hypothetical protein